MKNFANLKTVLQLIIVVFVTLVFSRVVNAAQIEDIFWSSGVESDDVLILQLDEHPEYVINQSANGTIIELTLKNTQISADITNLEPQGLVRSSIVTPQGEHLNIQLLLVGAGTANIQSVDAGFKVIIAAEATAPTENSTVVAAEKLSQESAGVLTDLRFSRVSGNRIQIDLLMNGNIRVPAVFKTVSPPSIVFDFHGIENDSDQIAFPVGILSLNKILIAEDNDRMRLVLDLNNPVEHSLSRVDSGYILTIGANAYQSNAISQPSTQATSTQATSTQTSSASQVSSADTKPSQHTIDSVDFRRAPNGGGRIVIEFSDNEVSVDLREQGNEIVAVFANTSIPADLMQRFDVMDFATPVTHFDTYAEGSHAKLVVNTTGQFRQSSVQAGSRLILDISPPTEAEAEADQTDEYGYTGERLSLNFQQISVRGALNIMRDFTDLNFVISDAVTGDLSLQLTDVAWDHALDVILQTKGLDMRQNGNVIWVAPADEIIATEQAALTAAQAKIELEPLVSELLRLSYAKANDVASLIKSVKPVDTGISQSGLGNVTVNEVKTEENSLLSSRGSVTVDDRTNSLLVQDTASKIREIKIMLARLDVPVRQVQIETRIVEANDDFSRNIGARLGFTRISQNTDVAGTGTDVGDVFAGGSLDQTNDIRTGSNTNFSDDGLSVNLPAGGIGSDAAGSYAFTLAKLGSGYLSLLDLEISALQAEGNGKILANPKILTTNNREATIEQGQERLSTFQSALGAPSSQGQKAVLSLTVTPQITVDDKIILDVDITNDAFVAANVDTVNTKRISTQALLGNGETVVIGGIYQQNESSSVVKVPILGDIPFLGVLFRKKTARNNRSELLIFLTPRIIDPNLAVQ